MSKAPLRVFRFLLGIHCQGYSRQRVCKATGLSPRTIDRAVGYLVDNGAVLRERGGRGQSAKLRAVMSLDKFLAHQVKMAHQERILAHQTVEIGALSGSLSLLKKTPEEHKERRPVENTQPPNPLTFEEAELIMREWYPGLSREELREKVAELLPGTDCKPTVREESLRQEPRKVVGMPGTSTRRTTSDPGAFTREIDDLAGKMRDRWRKIKP